MIKDYFGRVRIIEYLVLIITIFQDNTSYIFVEIIVYEYDEFWCVSRMSRDI